MKIGDLQQYKTKDHLLRTVPFFTSLIFRIHIKVYILMGSEQHSTASNLTLMYLTSGTMQKLFQMIYNGGFTCNELLSMFYLQLKEEESLKVNLQCLDRFGENNTFNNLSSGGSRISRRGRVDVVGGPRLPRRLYFENAVCRNERIWTLRGRGRAPGTPPRSTNAYRLSTEV